MVLSARERKAAFRGQAALLGLTAHGAANQEIGVTLFHLMEGIAGRRPLSAEVKAKFAAFIGRTVEEVFGPPVVRRRRAKNVA